MVKAKQCIHNRLKQEWKLGYKMIVRPVTVSVIVSLGWSSMFWWVSMEPLPITGWPSAMLSFPFISGLETSGDDGGSAGSLGVLTKWLFIPFAKTIRFTLAHLPNLKMKNNKLN
jgi:hypothetical protein